jgi:ATP-dependent DNA ligase
MFKKRGFAPILRLSLEPFHWPGVPSRDSSGLAGSLQPIQKPTHVAERRTHGRELVIGGYVPGSHGLDSIIVGYYKGPDLIYVARVKSGFVPATRRQVFEKLRHQTVPNCPFMNLPETQKGRWGDGLTAKDMEKCVWVRPEFVAQIEFLEWTESDRLRHSKFAGLGEDNDM